MRGEIGSVSFPTATARRVAIASTPGDGRKARSVPIILPQGIEIWWARKTCAVHPRGGRRLGCPGFDHCAATFAAKAFIPFRQLFRGPIEAVGRRGRSRTISFPVWAMFHAADSGLKWGGSACPIGVVSSVGRSAATWLVRRERGRICTRKRKKECFAQKRSAVTGHGPTKNGS